MVETTSAHATARDWRMVILIGGVELCGQLTPLLHFISAGRRVGERRAGARGLLFLRRNQSPCWPWRSPPVCAPASLRIDNQRMRVAINNMSQGLCMFDGNERLVVCNQRYMEMYDLCRRHR